MINLNLPTDRDKLALQIEQDINTFCETYYEQGHRNHLGASELGEECWRKLWYGFRWTKQERFDGRMMRLFNVGHSAEPRFVTYLKGIGFQVKEFETNILNLHPESDDYFWSVEFDPGDGLVEDVSGYAGHEAEAIKRGIKPKQFHISGCNGHYGGSLDGKAIPPARYEIEGEVIFLNEFKTNGTGAKFNDVAKLGLRKAKPMHFAQMSQYGYKMQIKYGMYLIENKNDSHITVQIVELDWNLGAQLEKKANDIINAREPPPRISDNPAWQNCQWCHQKDICHHGATPEKNCRSCRNSIPTENATWTCLRFGVIPESYIPIGCPDWIPI